VLLGVLAEVYPVEMTPYAERLTGIYLRGLSTEVIIFLTLILGTAGVIYVLMRLKRAAVKNNSSKEKKCSYNAI